METVAFIPRIRLNWEDPSTGHPQQQVYSLPVNIGRSPANNLVLNSDRVSRQHARIEEQNGQVVITDLQSSNGTFVNRNRISQTIQLVDGDLIRMGPFLLVIDLEPFADESTATDQLLLRWTEPHSGQAQQHPLNPPVSIGRDEGNSIVLDGERVSRYHALIERQNKQLVIKDRGATNGVLVNGRQETEVVIQTGDTLTIGAFTLTVTPAAADHSATLVSDLAPAAADPPVSQATLIFSEEDSLLPAASASDQARSDQFPPPIFDQERVPVQTLKDGPHPVAETTYLAVGGGLGSFSWVDHLVVYGVDQQQIMVVGLEEKPYGRYERLCNYSQIPAHERLRSDSGSTPDNLWGWPGYAVREMWSSFTKGNLGNMFSVGWAVFGEPTLSQTYTPRSGDVFKSIDREAQRIGWKQMWHYGHVKAIRKTDDGRYAVAMTQSSDESGRRYLVVLAPFVHLAVGYPGVRFLPDLQKYREETGDFKRVVNAYENHEHVYDHLRQRGGTILIRGRGIVASRIIQRAYEMRQHNNRIAILHLHRSALSEGNQFGRAQRPVDNHWEFQPFNWPKACWGGDLREMLEDASGPERDQLLNDWGGTTTADRQDWKDIVNDGLREGWYQNRFGSVKRVELDESGQLNTIIRGRGAIEEEMRLQTDFIVDCTGLEADITTNPLLRDILELYKLERNPKGRFQVANDFEIQGMRNGRGRLYASGVITLGGPYAAVDSFLGLQYSALRSVDALTKQRAPGLRYLNGLRSIYQWTRWARGVKP